MKLKFAMVLSCALTSGVTVAEDAVPTVTNVILTPREDGKAEISYALSATAVVTLDVETNVTGEVWASVGGENLWQLAGDAMKRVEGTSGSVVWTPPLALRQTLGTTPVRARVTAWPTNDTPDYLVVGLTASVPERIRYYPSAAFVPGGLTACDTYRTTRMAFKRIRAKGVTWKMGDADVGNGLPFGLPVRTVTMAHDYYLGVFPVTTAQAVHLGQTAVYGADGNSNVSTALRPCILSYNRWRESGSNAGDATYRYPNAPAPTSILGVLNKRSGLAFDLPSEAEWEYAARAGYANGRWNDGGTCGVDPMPGFCRETGGGSGFDPNALPGAAGGTAVVGSFKASDWGLYDMAGNNFEWCLDWFTRDAAILEKAGASANAWGDLMADGLTQGSERTVKKNMPWASWFWHRPAIRLSASPEIGVKGGDFFGARFCCRAGLL